MYIHVSVVLCLYSVVSDEASARDSLCGGGVLGLSWQALCIIEPPYSKCKGTLFFDMKRLFVFFSEECIAC